MKTSTMMWTLAVLIILISAGAYYYSNSIGTSNTTTTTNEIPNPSGSNLPAGDLAPVPATPIASSSANINASTSLGH
jgi:hypothetical protein